MQTIQPGTTTRKPAPSGRAIRVGCVSYLNTLPLIEGLDKLPRIDLVPAPPCRLADMLASREADIALASIIDYQRATVPLAILPAGIIGSRGPTRTVRLFLSGEPADIKRIAIDTDSHTSVALAHIILAERFDVRPQRVDFDARSESIDESCDALLVIGDKVEADPRWRQRFEHSLDLGEQWTTLTDLPFVYATWMCRLEDANDPDILAAGTLLRRQRLHNATRIRWIAQHHATAHAWTTERALDYITTHLQFDLTEEHTRAIDTFFDLALRHGLIQSKRDLLRAEI